LEEFFLDKNLGGFSFMRKPSRPVTRWEILYAFIVCISAIIGGLIGYSYPEHPILGRSRGVLIFLIITCIIFVVIEKCFGLSKKIEAEIAKRLKESEHVKNEEDKSEK
jgi:hypothetical protein